MQPKIKITGQKELFRKLAQFGDEAEKRIDQITHATATQIADQAKANAPRANAEINIAQTINVSKESHLFYTVNVNAVPIAAYLEFGTGAFVEVAPEWKDLAWEFYVNGKGRLHPQPYLYPAYTRGKKIYEANLNALLDHLTKKHSK